MRPKKSKKKKPFLLWRLLKRYLANSSIHGVGYLVEDGSHWTERLFWLISCGLSWWGCAVLIIGVLDDFDNRRTAVTVETDYLHWYAELPSIHLCAQPGPDSREYVTKTWKKERGFPKLETDRNLGYERALPKPHGSEAFEGLAVSMQLNCTRLFDYCEWDGKEIDCCEAFRPLSTRVGSCLSINSVFTTHTDSSKGDYENQTFKIRHPRRDVLKVRLKKTEYWTKFTKLFNVYLLSSAEIPTVATNHEKMFVNKWKTSELAIIDVVQKPTHNKAGVRSVPIAKRNCRFINENENSKIYRYYSYDTCVAQADLQRMYDTCGCISHLNPRFPGTPVCNQTQLKCIWDSNNLIYNDDYSACVPDCEATEYTFFETYSDEQTDEGAHFTVNLMPGPTLRYVRYVVHSKLDVVVSVGGALGLFVGASILSIVEIPYWFLVRSIDDNDDDDDEHSTVDEGEKNN